MPPTLSFKNVPDKGFASFGHTLEKSPWLEIPLPNPSDELCDCPFLCVAKGRLLEVVQGVLRAMGQTNKVQDAHHEWNRTQIRLDCQVRLDEHDGSFERRATARRVRKALLDGEGTAQIALRAEAALDYGRSQVSQCDDLNGSLHADIAALGYRAFLEDIGKANDGLALAVGRDIAGSRAIPRSILVRDAVRAAATTFYAVVHELDYLLDHTPASAPSHKKLTELRNTLQKLLENYASNSDGDEGSSHDNHTTPPPPTAPSPASEAERQG